MELKGRLLGLVALLLALVENGNAAADFSHHQIRLFISGRPVITTLDPTYNSDEMKIPHTLEATRRTNVETKFSSAATVCAYGMWALYNRTNFGEDFETTTGVTGLRGYDPGACASSSAYPVFKTIKSIQFLGNMNPTFDGLDIYSGTNFKGGAVKYTVLPDEGTLTRVGGGVISAIRLGSLAITGLGRWRLCSDLTTCVCIDMNKQRMGMYMNKDVISDKTTAWPTFVRYVGIADDSDACQMDGNPPIAVANSASVNALSGTGRKPAKPILEIV